MKETRILTIDNRGRIVIPQIIRKSIGISLAKIATVFGNHGVSLVYGESTTIEKGKKALWTVIGPKPEDLDPEEFKNILMNEGDAVEVEIIPIE